MSVFSAFIFMFGFVNKLLSTSVINSQQSKIPGMEHSPATKMFVPPNGDEYEYVEEEEDHDERGSLGDVEAFSGSVFDNDDQNQNLNPIPSTSHSDSGTTITTSASICALDLCDPTPYPLNNYSGYSGYSNYSGYSDYSSSRCYNDFRG
jgi:hypothetical protein